MAKRNYTKVVRSNRSVYVRGKNGEPGAEALRLIECYIDWDALLWRLGSKAVNSKSGRSTLSQGLILVKEVRS